MNTFNPMQYSRLLGLSIGLLLASYFSSFAQPTENVTSSEIFHKLLKLQETKRVLYVAAHPDDENTRLIAFLGNEMHAEVAYLSLTRGDGGQNLIGKELGKELGMIRTQELLKAREIDGGRQYFTRAMDFGFSKNPDETFNNWDKDVLLGDVVWVIRTFKPDIIITRFTSEPGVTHGHHTSSAILAEEAFKIAGDATKFPEQLAYTSVWSPKRIFWNAYNWGGEYEKEDGKTYESFPVGKYNSLLGQSYSQIAADSRTMHKSQGFGATAQIGEGTDYIQLLDGPTFEKSPFEDIENRWDALNNGEEVKRALDELLASFDFVTPANNIDKLLALRKELNASQSDQIWLQEKNEALDEIIFRSLGIKAEFNANQELSFPGKEVKTTLVFNNPSEKDIEIVDFKVLGNSYSRGEVASNNKPVREEIVLSLPTDLPISQPYWLEESIAENIFAVSRQEAIGRAFNEPTVAGKVSFKIDGQDFEKSLPLFYKFNDQVDGETKQPFTLTPEILVHVSSDNHFISNRNENTLEVEVGFFEKIREGKLSFEGLDESHYKILHNRTDEVRQKKVFTVEILGLPSGIQKQTVTAQFTLADGRVYNRDMRRIKYKHIPNLTHFPKSQVNILDLDLNMSGKRIGYIAGAGDDVPEVLRQLGYEVAFVDNLTTSSLKDFETIITGIRAFNVNENLANNVDHLMDYVKEGGNLIIQYNTSSPLLNRQLGPYPIQLSRDRVTVEDSPVEFDSEHPIFSHPNTIKEDDFKGWVQERGLYFAGEWDDAYQAPLAMHDPGETPKKGSLLFAQHGEGTFTYSGISWFRLLPAGVPGAIKLFVNLIEQGSGSE